LPAVEDFAGSSSAWRDGVVLMIMAALPCAAAVAASSTWKFSTPLGAVFAALT
jgi:hypothetical protein